MIFVGFLGGLLQEKNLNFSSQKVFAQGTYDRRTMLIICFDRRNSKNS